MDTTGDNDGIEPCIFQVTDRRRRIQPEIDAAIGDLAAVITQHFVELDLARDCSGKVELPAYAISGLKQGYLVPASAGFRGSCETARACANHCDPARGLSRAVLKLSLAAGTRINQATRGPLGKDQVEAGLIAGNADVDFAGVALPHLPGEVRIGQHRAGHRY